MVHFLAHEILTHIIGSGMNHHCHNNAQEKEEECGNPTHYQYLFLIH
jgi:hypothetical protein